MITGGGGCRRYVCIQIALDGNVSLGKASNYIRVLCGKQPSAMRLGIVAMLYVWNTVRRRRASVAGASRTSVTSFFPDFAIFALASPKCH